jgi:hypothetical protein
MLWMTAMGFAKRSTHPTICCLAGKSVTRLSFACPALFAKIFWFSEDPNHFYIRCRPVPQEGRLAIVTDAGRDAVDARRRADEALLERTAKSCGPDASTPASSWQ